MPSARPLPAFLPGRSQREQRLSRSGMQRKERGAVRLRLRFKADQGIACTMCKRVRSSVAGRVLQSQLSGIEAIEQEHAFRPA